MYLLAQIVILQSQRIQFHLRFINFSNLSKTFWHYSFILNVCFYFINTVPIFILFFLLLSLGFTYYSFLKLLEIFFWPFFLSFIYTYIEVLNFSLFSALAVPYRIFIILFNINLSCNFFFDLLFRKTLIFSKIFENFLSCFC